MTGGAEIEHTGALGEFWRSGDHQPVIDGSGLVRELRTLTDVVVRDLVGHECALVVGRSDLERSHALTTGRLVRAVRRARTHRVCAVQRRRREDRTCEISAAATAGLDHEKRSVDHNYRSTAVFGRGRVVERLRERHVPGCTT